MFFATSYLLAPCYIIFFNFKNKFYNKMNYTWGFFGTSPSK